MNYNVVFITERTSNKGPLTYLVTVILPIEFVTAGQKIHLFAVGLGCRVRYFLTDSRSIHRSSPSDTTRRPIKGRRSKSQMVRTIWGTTCRKRIDLFSRRKHKCMYHTLPQHPTLTKNRKNTAKSLALLDCTHLQPWSFTEIISSSAVNLTCWCR